MRKEQLIFRRKSLESNKMIRTCRKSFILQMKSYKIPKSRIKELHKSIREEKVRFNPGEPRSNFLWRIRFLYVRFGQKQLTTAKK